jgi:N-acetylmuramoyl-L-alanine amidase
MQFTTHNKSPNFTEARTPREIRFIILHYTDIEFESALAKLCDENAEVSSHYLIHKDGEIYHLVDDEKIAWHAGRSQWHETIDLNPCSIGIEIDNPGDEPFTDEQMKSCMQLCKYLQEKYDIQSHNIIGHSDIAPHRKWDPGVFFDWNLLLENGMGIPFALPDADLENNVIFSKGDTGIEKLQQNLKNIGYKIEITGIFDDQTNFVVRAFQSHFAQKSIWKRGGIKYFRNPDSDFVWDDFSHSILSTIKTQNLLDISCAKR